MRRTIATLATTTSLAVTAALAASPFDNWRLLDSVEITEVVQNDIWIAQKTFPDDLVAARDGFTIEGFYLPIEAQAQITSFLLIRDPAECPFCGGGGYGPSLEVTLARPMNDRELYTRITIQGQLELIDDPETYMAYRLVDAEVLD